MIPGRRQAAEQSGNQQPAISNTKKMRKGGVNVVDLSRLNSRAPDPQAVNRGQRRAQEEPCRKSPIIEKHQRDSGQIEPITSHQPACMRQIETRKDVKPARVEPPYGGYEYSPQGQGHQLQVQQVRQGRHIARARKIEKRNRVDHQQKKERESGTEDQEHPNSP